MHHHHTSSPRRLRGGRWYVALALGLLGSTACLSGGCESAPRTRAIEVDTQTPETLLASLKAAARISLNGYYDALRQATDCEALPEFCRLLEARREAAMEMVRLRNTMVERYGEEGRVAAGEMLRAAFLDQFDEVERATVFVGSGEAAVMRIGTSVYRLRRRDGAWRIVQFPDPPYDPTVSADAIELLVERVEAIRQDVIAGRVPSMAELDVRIAAALGG